MQYKETIQPKLKVEFDFIEGNKDGSAHDEIIITNMEDIESQIIDILCKIRNKKECNE